MPTPTAKSEATRELLVSSALRLFRDVGYEKTTMRAIALAANVSTGSAYYYLASKDDLAHEQYRSLQEEHQTVALPLLRDEQNLGELRRIVLNPGIDVMAPFHDFGSNFISIAIKPSATTRTFGSESAVASARAITLFRQALSMTLPQPPLAIRDDLPELLRYASISIILFRVYDSSPAQTRTCRLINQVTPLISRLVILSRLPVARKIVEDIVRLIRGTRQ